MDDAGLLVNLTQFRNILTGTIPQPNPYQTPSQTVNQDANSVMFGTDPINNPVFYYLPNSIADNYDLSTTGQVFRTGIPVAGRWGEVNFIPGNPNSNPQRPVLFTFNNLIRAGMSMTNYNTISMTFMPYDLDDDNFNSFDPIGSPPRTWITTTRLALERPGRADPAVHDPDRRRGRRMDGGVRVDVAPERPLWCRYLRPDQLLQVLPAPGMPNTVWSGGPVAPTIPDMTTNPLHGFESAQNPNMYALTPP